MCLDSAVGEEESNKPVTPYPCHDQGGNQYWMLSKDGEIRRDESCVDFAGQDVMIFPCHGMKGNQEWRYDPKLNQLLHTVTNKCLEMTKDGARLQMRSCGSENAYQQWVFQNFEEEKAKRVGMLR
jgi:polypeptide N-acetylgalactosaminyltransferase